MAGAACGARLAGLAQLPRGTKVIADAGFGSVVGAAYLRAKLGLFCTMNVKGDHPALFPKEKICELLAGHGAGASVCLRADVQWGDHTVPMLAVGFRFSRSKEPQLFVSTIGSMAR